MAVTERTSRSTAIIGIIELFLALIAIICGVVVMSKTTSPARVTIGIWALYVSTKELVACPQKIVTVCYTNSGKCISW